MPDIFFLTHPVGTVLGNADYSDFLVVSQNVVVNIGVSIVGESRPKLGKGLYLVAGAKIIGNETIGNRVSVGVDAVIYNQVVSDDRIIEPTTDGTIWIRGRRQRQ